MSEAKKDDALVAYILERAAAPEPATAADIARDFAAGRVKPREGKDAWRRYLAPVRQQVLHLARTGRIVLTRDGEPVDLDDAKGRLFIRLPEDAKK